MHVYISEKHVVYILNIFFNINYMNINIDMLIHENIFKMYTVCVFLYIHNIHRTHILCKQKLIFYAINPN